MSSELQSILEPLRSNDWDVAASRLVAAAAVFGDGDATLLTRLSHALLAATLVDPALAFGSLERLTWMLDSAPLPLQDRVRLQCMDAYWRMHGADMPVADREWIERCAVAALARQGRTPSPLLFLGALRMTKQDREGAYSLFTEAAESAERLGGLARMYTGAYSIRPHAKLFNWRQAALSGWPPAVTPTLHWKHPPIDRDLGSPKALVVFGADPIYFTDFSGDIVEQLRKLRSTSDLHFHVTGWSAACEARFKEIQTAHRGTISVTWEPYKYTRDRTYFATVRFLRAHQIMCETGRPVYITDIDNRFLARPEDILPKMQPFDAGFRMNSNSNWFPWWGPAAGNLFLNNTSAGRGIAALLEAYIRAHFKPNSYPKSWWFDQLALNEVLACLENDASAALIANLTDPPMWLTTTRPAGDIAERKGVRAP